MNLRIAYNPSVPTGEFPTALLLRSALAGWVAMIAIFAVCTFLLPHGPHFAPEVGRLGAFIIFGSVLSASYLADFVFLEKPDPCDSGGSSLHAISRVLHSDAA